MDGWCYGQVAKRMSNRETCAASPDDVSKIISVLMYVGMCVYVCVCVCVCVCTFSHACAFLVDP